MAVYFAKVTLRDVNEDPSKPYSPVESAASECADLDSNAAEIAVAPAEESPIQTVPDIASQLAEAAQAWLMRSPSVETRRGYARDLAFFFRFHGVAVGTWTWLISVRPLQVAAWRDHLLAAGYSNAAIGRKLTVLRSLFSYLRSYGYAGANPADQAYVSTPPIAKDGRTIGLTPTDCRRLMDAPSSTTPEGIRDRAIFGVLAYTGCRVGELCRIRVSDFKGSSDQSVF